MAKERCTFCTGELEHRTVQPCHFCGGYNDNPSRRPYVELELAEKHILLCYSCHLEEVLLATQQEPRFSPESFGLGTTELRDAFHVVREIETPPAQEDQVCVDCGNRLRFMRFREAVRARVRPDA